MTEFTGCRCGKRIPKTWPRCVACQTWADQDMLEDGLSRRMDRAQLVRVRRSMDFEVTTPLNAEQQQTLRDGIARVSQEHHILKTRADMKARQHIQVLYRNAKAHNLDVVDNEEFYQP